MDNEFFTLTETPLSNEGSNEGSKEISKEDALLDAWLASEKDTGYETNEHFKSCQSCGATDDMILHEDVVVCTGCGEILARPIDSSAEYRYFGMEDRGGGDPSRIGAPFDPRLPESSLGTVILPQGNAKHMGKIRRYHQWNMLPYKERALLGAFDRLSLAANNHGLGGSIIEDAKELYVKLNGFCDRRGLSRDSLLASCVYTALKRAGSPRKPQDIGAMFSLSHASFTKAFKFFQEVLAQARQKGLLTESWTPSNLTSTRAADYVSVPLSKLPISRADYQKLLVEAQGLAERAETEGMSPENTPPSLAAGIVAYVCERWRKGEIPLARIASACDVSLATLQKCLRRLQSILDT
jgi:transcription initiation factor TFIIIB Brf1 subunit/transcription initiation factor TFIIB